MADTITPTELAEIVWDVPNGDSRSYWARNVRRVAREHYQDDPHVRSSDWHLTAEQVAVVLRDMLRDHPDRWRTD
jgi:GrpB-like predicted nucleotidyltransferase (UPF0157 family)